MTVNTLKSGGLIENEALYNLKLEIIEAEENLFFPDPRIKVDLCNAT